MKRTIIVFCILTVAGLFRCQCDESSLGSLQSRLVILINNQEVTDSFHFGDITVTKEISADVQLKNVGETEIEIGSITIEQRGDVFNVDPMDKMSGFANNKIILATNSVLNFKIYYRPVNPAPPSDEGTLVISTNMKEQKDISIKLTGNGIKASIEINPVDIIDFGKVDLYSKATKDVVIKNTGTDVLTISSIKYTPSGNSTDIRLDTTQKLPVELNPNREVTFTLTYVPTDIGEDKGTLSIESSSKDLPEVNIPVKGEGVAPLIKIEPSAIDFGGVEVNQSLTKDFTVYNNGNKDLIIYKLDFAENSSKYLSVTDPNVEKTLSPQSSTKYSITYAPKDKEGSLISKLQIHCNDPQLIDRDADNHYIAYVDIKSRTPFPKIDVPGGVTFQLGCKSPYDDKDPACTSGCSENCCCLDYGAKPEKTGLIIRNVGDAPLTVTRVELTEDGNGMLEIIPEKNTPYTLGNNEQTKVVIRFKARDFGQQRGKIVIESNDPNYPVSEVSIVATAYQK
jgi:hypothetical protein